MAASEGSAFTPCPPSGSSVDQTRARGLSLVAHLGQAPGDTLPAGSASNPGAARGERSAWPRTKTRRSIVPTWTGDDRGADLSDDQWRLIEPQLPHDHRRGGQWRDHRQVVNGILWKLRTGAPWRRVPARYGPWQTCYDRFQRWQKDGTWSTVLAVVRLDGERS